ncbi:Glycerol-3-phosphate dehydrogenase, partial [hydrothermal vent metagenome]
MLNGRMMTKTQNLLHEETFDVAIIGAGIVGCAMARRFTLEGANVALIEKAPDILDGASKANSAILHTGFDAPPGSLELQCIQNGHREYLDIRARHGLMLDPCGAYVVA